MADKTLIEMLHDHGLVVDDRRWKLPTNPTVSWNIRTHDQIRLLVIHHSAGAAVDNVTRIAQVHIDLGWPGIAYTWAVLPDGVLVFCHTLTTWGPQAGVGHVNKYSCGIVLLGNFVSVTPPKVQSEAASELITVLKEFLPWGSEPTIGHFHVSNTQCPGLAWETLRWSNQDLPKEKVSLPQWIWNKIVRMK